MATDLMLNDLMMSDDLMQSTPKTSHNPLEQFVLLAKNAKGAACSELILQVLEQNGVHCFGELLAMPNIVEVIFIQNELVVDCKWWFWLTIPAREWSAQ